MTRTTFTEDSLNTKPNFFPYETVALITLELDQNYKSLNDFNNVISTQEKHIRRQNEELDIERLDINSTNGDFEFRKKLNTLQQEMNELIRLQKLLNEARIIVRYIKNIKFPNTEGISKADKKCLGFIRTEGDSMDPNLIGLTGFGLYRWLLNHNPDIADEYRIIPMKQENNTQENLNKIKQLEDEIETLEKENKKLSQYKTRLNSESYLKAIATLTCLLFEAKPSQYCKPNQHEVSAKKIREQAESIIGLEGLSNLDKDILTALKLPEIQTALDRINKNRLK